MQPCARTLREGQYRDGRNLLARIALHERFSTNPQGWYPFVLAQLALHIARGVGARVGPGTQILELGCGAGGLWTEALRNDAALGPRVRIILSDGSPGMLAQTQRALAEHGDGAFAFASADATAIPFRKETFDGVIANHMLYHVTDRARALSEVARVLRPDGWLAAATNGEDHMGELDALLARHAALGHVPGQAMCAPFTLENGPAQLERWFGQIALHRYADTLRVTDAQAVIDYACSMDDARALSRETLALVRGEVEDQIARHGAFLITKNVGLFLATQPRR
jgi:SAM-dependent methyltransferase